MPSFLDRIKGFINPKAESAPKPQASTLYGGMGTSQFESAKLSRRRGYIWTPAPQDFRKEMMVGDRLEMLRKSRYLEKNSGFYREFIHSMCGYAVSNGIGTQVNTDDEEYNKESEEYIKEWSYQCEITGRFCFEEVQSIVCKAIDRDGEIFIIFTRDDEGRGKIQLIESHRVGNATANVDGLVDGILYDPVGRIISYRVIEDDGSFRDIPAQSCIHVFDPEQISQTRGYPTMQHAINHIYDEMELIAMEKQAIKDQSDITRVFVKANPSEDAGDYPDLGEANYEDANVTEFKRNFGGKSMVVDQGEKLEHLESKRPNSTFTGFLEHLRRDSSQGAMPYEFIADPSKIGGASVRLVVAKADRIFQHRQNILINRFIRPVITYIIADAINRGELEEVDNWNKFTFTTPCRVTVDAGRQSDQERSDIEFGLGTLADSYAARGMDVRAELERKAKETKMINEIAAKYGVDPTSIYKLASGIKATMAPNPFDPAGGAMPAGVPAPANGKTDATGNVEGENKPPFGVPTPNPQFPIEDEEETEEAEEIEEGEEAEAESEEEVEGEEVEEVVEGEEVIVGDEPKEKNEYEEEAQDVPSKSDVDVEPIQTDRGIDEPNSQPRKRK
jgi:capsid protein